jgi:CBS domain-containing protein
MSADEILTFNKPVPTNLEKSEEFCNICKEIERFETKSKRIQQNIDNLKKVLDIANVYEVTEQWSRGPPVVIYAGQTIQYALYLINKYRVFSLPVLNQSDLMIGLVDILDIIKELVAQNFETNYEYDQEYLKKFMETHVDQLFNLQFDKNRSKSFVIARQTNLLSLIRHMVGLKRDRFVIVDRVVAGDVEEQPYPETFFQGIVSSADVLRFLTKFPTWIKKESFFKQKMSELFKKFREPHIVCENEITSRVFTEMGDIASKGAAVVDESGKLLFNLSPSDLKGITISNYFILNAPLKEFLKQDRARDWWTEPICADLESSLYETMQQFVCTKVHHMFIVDAEGKPTGVLNHRDILSQILIFYNSKQGDQ